ncbi:MAG: type II toxin-antitoxin system RelE/ParE family toxin [Catalinimonas sp.]
MKYQIVIRRRVSKEIDRLPQKARQLVARKLNALAENPRRPGVIKLQGEKDRYRIRAGDYRIVYEIEDDILKVLVVRIRNRKDVYD